MIAPLVEQFPPADDQEANLPLDASEGLSPPVEAVDAPVEPAEPSRAELLEANARLEADNALMRARLAQLEMPEEKFLPLKRGAAACNPPLHYERVRKLAVAGKIRTRREGKLWFIDPGSVDRYRQSLGLSKK